MEPLYRRHRFPPEIISHAIWLYHRFTLSFRDVEDLLAERGIQVSCEAIRYWCLKFGPGYARAIRRKQGRLGDIWFVDELFIKIRGQRYYLWRAVDQDGDVIDILVTRRRDRRAAKRFFRTALKHQERPPWQLVTDKLRSYGAAQREVFPSVVHRTGQYENNQAEVSHQHTREQERQMRRFKSMAQTQRFLSVHGPIQNLFRVGRHHVRAVNHRILRERAFVSWRQITCASNAEINRELAALKRAFSLAVKDGKLMVKPHIPSLKENNVCTGFFEPEQFARVRSYLPLPLQAVVTFAYFTGWRIRSEILTLQWRQVDVKVGRIVLDPGTTKNDEGRIFPFTDELRALFQEQWEITRQVRRSKKRVCPWVFHRDGERIKSFYAAWRTACKKAGRPHPPRLSSNGRPELGAGRCSGKGRDEDDRAQDT